MIKYRLKVLCLSGPTEILWLQIWGDRLTEKGSNLVWIYVWDGDD